jgi:hypothetical protein
MFSSEVRRLLVQVITSWQVIAVTVVLVIYIFIVNYVARIYNRNSRIRNSRRSFIPKVKKEKSEPPIHSEIDELDLEEETKK